MARGPGRSPRRDAPVSDGLSSIEFALLLSCAQVCETQETNTTLRQLLEQEIDWRRFVQRLIDHDLTSLVAQRLLDFGSDLLPEDIVDAFEATVAQARVQNSSHLDELPRLLGTMTGRHVEAIAFGGPLLALDAYRDMGERAPSSIALLVRDSALSAAVAELASLGYARKPRLTVVQLEAIHRLEGRELLVNEKLRTGVELHTRLAPKEIALDIDHEALWRRAQQRSVNGRSILALSPQDALLALAIRGGVGSWRKMGLARDFAALASRQPRLDWAQLAEGARAQGCLRILLLTSSLARAAFGFAPSEALIAPTRADPWIERMTRRVMADWCLQKTNQEPDRLSLARLRLHDGVLRQARYAVRACLLPERRHVEAISLPERLAFVYVTVKAADAVTASPVWQASRRAFMHIKRMLALTPKRLRLAQADAERAIARNARNPRAWRNLGNALLELKRYRQAIACYDKSLAIAPDNRHAWAMRTAALRALGAKNLLPDPPSADSRDADAWLLRAGGLWYTKRLSEAAEAAERALALDPDNERAARLAIHCRLHACDWTRRDEDKQRIRSALAAGRCLVVSGDHLSLSDSEAENQLTAQLLANGMPAPAETLWSGERYRHERIRLAYLSSDFREHPVSTLLTGCLEAHDKGRFELTAISTGPDDGSEQRRRVIAAVEHFIDAHEMEDRAVAALMRKREIDIAVDLNGYTDGYRPGILARRPVPVQANYLGYAGTTCLPFRDYIIADRVVIPEENCRYYSESVVYLPHCYLPNDRSRPIAHSTPSRSEAQLPETGFVFACFNETYKIGPEIFGAWMRLLHAVDDSALWLRTTTGDAIANLRRQARAHGIAPERLVFAPRLTRAEDHLARHRLADLGLDTLPRNLHSTACDALWAGLPLVTCMGKTFTGRVSASALLAVGLPELVTSSLAEYEELARSLATKPNELAAIKAKLALNRELAPLFDTVGHTRHLEVAYMTIWERLQAGLPPARFAVPG